jgi:hypothetical protein
MPHVISDRANDLAIHRRAVNVGFVFEEGVDIRWCADLKSEKLALLLLPHPIAPLRFMMALLMHQSRQHMGDTEAPTRARQPTPD